MPNYLGAALFGGVVLVVALLAYLRLRREQIRPQGPQTTWTPDPAMGTLLGLEVEDDHRRELDQFVQDAIEEAEDALAALYSEEDCA